MYKVYIMPRSLGAIFSHWNPTITNSQLNFLIFKNL